MSGFCRKLLAFLRHFVDSVSFGLPPWSRDSSLQLFNDCNSAGGFVTVHFDVLYNSLHPMDMFFLVLLVPIA
jgi:hypothetical protein